MIGDGAGVSSSSRVFAAELFDTWKYSAHNILHTNDQIGDPSLVVTIFLLVLLMNLENSSSLDRDPSNMHEFYQQHRYTDKWTKNHGIEQVIGDPSKPVQTRNQLQTDAALCIYALTVSLIEPKNIKEDMLDHSWIESMQDELNQFKRLDVWELVPLPEGRHAIKVYHLKKAMYGLKQAPQAWYDKLSSFLIEHHFTKDNFEMSMMGEMKFFLGLHIHQSPRGIFTNQSQYTMELLRKQGMKKCDTVTTPMATAKIDADLQARQLRNTSTRSKGSFDADLAGCLNDYKSTSGGLQFLGDKLVSWSSKKQNCTTMSTAEAEYVSLSACCAQVIWMRTQLLDYEYRYNKIPMYYDSKMQLPYRAIWTKYQLADLFTKALPRESCILTTVLENSPQGETPENPFVAPVNIEIIESFMHTVGYQGVVEKKFPSIPLRLEEDYHFIKDDITLVSVYTMGNMTVREKLIPNAFLTKEIRATNDYIECETVFVNVIVPMNQPQPVVSTQGTQRTAPRAHRTPTLTASPQGKKRKQNARETNKIEPGSHKEHPKVVVVVVDDDDDDKEEKKDDEMDKNIAHELTDTVSLSTTTTSNDSHKKRRIFSKYSHLPGALRRMCRGQGYMIRDMERMMHFTHNDMMTIKKMMLLLRREKRMKRHKTTKSSKSARGSSPKQSVKDSISYRVHDFQLGIKIYQIKVNLTAPTLTFSGIKAHEPYSIVDKPTTGLIYLNSKNEKRVKYLVEIIKLCDAMLERVLNEIKLRIFQNRFWKKLSRLGELDLDIMRAFEREISKRLSHRLQMRRWESFLNGRPILPTMKRLGASSRGSSATPRRYVKNPSSKLLVTPQLHESAGGLPRLKLPLHSCSLATNTIKFTSLLVIVKREDFKDDILNSIMQNLGYEMDDEVLFYYKIPLKSLDIGLKPLVSESDYRSFLGYVQKHKVMHVYVELVEKDEEHDSDSDSDSDSESDNEIVDEEHVVDEVEVNMNNFKFQIDEKDKSSGNDAIVPNVNVTEDNLEVLDFDLLESDLEDVPENARSFRT
nr:hypothetical protein [Tanacetum cinerariifolium]